MNDINEVNNPNNNKQEFEPIINCIQSPYNGTPNVYNTTWPEMHEKQTPKPS